MPLRPLTMALLLLLLLLLLRLLQLLQLLPLLLLLLSPRLCCRLPLKLLPLGLLDRDASASSPVLLRSGDRCRCRFLKLLLALLLLW